jgi:hypothetical protein
LKILRAYLPSLQPPYLFFKPMQLPVWPSFTTAVRRDLNQSLRLWENTAFTCVGRRYVLGNSLSGIKGDSTVSGSHGIGRVFGLSKPNRESRRADSNRLPLLQLRVIGQGLQEFARGCKFRIDKPVSLPCLAACCTVLRSRWYQDERQLQSDGRSNGTPSRPSEPQSADTCFWALPYVAELAYLRRFPCWRLPTVSARCALRGVSSGVIQHHCV